MPEYRQAAKDVAWKATKYDGFKLVKTEHTYKHQRGSGRSQCFALAKNGMKISDWTKLCAKAGWTAGFATGCLDKLMGAKAPGWLPSDKNDKGLGWVAVRKTRESRAKATPKPTKKAA